MNYAVTDYDNYRVLIYGTPFSTNQGASVVLGQTDFTHNAPLSTSSSSVDPYAIAVDSSSNLYVSDANTCRVLLFKPPFTNNMAASVVIGEPDFITNSCGISASRLDGIEAIAIDGDGDLWVSDSSSRIMEFVPPFSNGMAASLVIGQVSLSTSSGCNQGLGAPSASTLCFAYGLTFDSSGNLWVSDSGNARVLEFKPPFSNGMAASLELGQPAGATAFTSSTPNNGGVSASSIDFPYQPAFDGEGNLWVPDINNNRVLEYTPPFSNGMAATLELGQPSGATAFTTRTAYTTQSGLYLPYGISFDSSGNIQVVDYGNNRVMIFNPPFSNGMNATTVLGQTIFTSGFPNQNSSVGANTLNYPTSGVTF
jgi:sugar lactone lactonase YvrE